MEKINIYMIDLKNPPLWFKVEKFWKENGTAFMILGGIIAYTNIKSGKPIGEILISLGSAKISSRIGCIIGECGKRVLGL